MRTEIRGRGAIADVAGFARYQSEIARRLAHFPGTPLGRSSPERWTRIEQSLIEVGAIPHPVDLRAFLYDPNARAGGGVGRLFVLVAGAVVALLAASLLWRRRRYRALPHLGTRLPSAEPMATDLDTLLTALEPRLRRRLPGAVELSLSLLPDPWLCRADAGAVGVAILALAEEAAAQMGGRGALIIGIRHLTIDRTTVAEMPGSAARRVCPTDGQGCRPGPLRRPPL